MALYQYTITKKQPSDDSAIKESAKNLQLAGGLSIIQQVSQTKDGLKIEFRISLQQQEVCLCNTLSLVNPNNQAKISVVKEVEEEDIRNRTTSNGSLFSTTLSTDSIEKPVSHDFSMLNQKKEQDDDSLKSNQLEDQTQEDADFYEECASSTQPDKISDLARADKKNVVKNFVKAFRGYLTQWGDENTVKFIMNIGDEELTRIRTKFVAYEKKRKYNNKLIKDLLVHKEYKDIFHYFLQNEAEKWLTQSQVIDKDSHKVVLKFYLEACNYPKELEKLKVLKGKRRPIQKSMTQI